MPYSHIFIGSNSIFYSHVAKNQSLISFQSVVSIYSFMCCINILTPFIAFVPEILSSKLLHCNVSLSICQVITTNRSLRPSILVHHRVVSCPHCSSHSTTTALPSTFLKKISCCFLRSVYIQYFLKYVYTLL